MENRPTEPGDWWWEDIKGSQFILRVIYNSKRRCLTSSCGASVDMIDDTDEGWVYFKCWLGKAVPPNNCDTCQHGQSCDEMGPCDVCEPTGFTHWGI